MPEVRHDQTAGTGSAAQLNDARSRRRRLTRALLFVLSRHAGRSPLDDVALAALEALDHIGEAEVVEDCLERVALALVLGHDEPEKRR